MNTTRATIITKSKSLFAKNGYEGFSIRILAKKTDIGISSIYHFFNDKDELLKEIFDKTNTELGRKRQLLPSVDSAADMMRQRITFQFEYIEDVVFVLKYYLHFRPHFLKIDAGYLPTKGYLHIEEVLVRGVNSGEFTIAQNAIGKEAKVIAHAINGFLLEYYPNPPTGLERELVIDSIHIFLMRSLTNKEVAVK